MLATIKSTEAQPLALYLCPLDHDLWPELGRTLLAVCVCVCMCVRAEVGGRGMAQGPG